ncbi:MAG: hypothetical protein AB7K24_00715 [Gemmataceae bacterium]
MNYPSPEFDAALAALCHGTASTAELKDLYELLAGNGAARDDYLWHVELHARLASMDMAPLAPAAATPSVLSRQAKVRPRLTIGLVIGMAAAAAVVLAVLLGSPRVPDPAPAVAVFREAHHVRWVAADVDYQPGDRIHAGQRLELSAGQVHIEFASGATTIIQGPAILEVESENSGFLVLGRVTVTADTPASKGFTIRTRTARVVDLGTEFAAEASADGHSWFGVISGEVEVHRDGSDAAQRLSKGEMLTVEAGRQQVMVRVERGDESPEFRFPSIESPSNRDYADARQAHASIRVVQGVLKSSKVGGNSGPPEKLIDGHGQSGPDVPEESVFFQNEITGRLLMDLGRTVAVSKINTYSWHQNGAIPGNRLRALQNYTLYGFAGAEPPATDGDLEKAGWQPIARVNTDEFFRVVQRLDRPAQQGCSITSATGTLGRYRYLLWDVLPSRYPDFKQLNNSFYGEFDVYAQP